MEACIVYEILIFTEYDYLGGVGRFFISCDMCFRGDGFY